MDEEAVVVEQMDVDTFVDGPKCIDHYMPQIFWHDRKQIMSVHIQPIAATDQYTSEEAHNSSLHYKICTASVQHEVRVWEIYFDKSQKPGFENQFEMGVNFVANLVGHTTTLNVAQYSPDGQLIASGDVDGKLFIWKVFPRDEDFIQTEDKPINDESELFAIPPNKENWLRAFVPIGHDSDLNALAFSPNSQFICTAASDDLRLTNTITGKQAWCNRNFRRLITGLTWDPSTRYIVSMSSDRRLDIIDAKRGHRLRTCHSHTIPETIIDGKKFEERVYKLFFGQHVYTLTRSPHFSPCGELLFAPAGQLESADANIYGTYMFRRCDFDSCLPYTFFPCAKPTLMVRVSPVKYELREDVEQNLSELPYRLIFAVMCAESIFFYDSQTDVPIGFVYDLSYDNLTSISWSPDGKMLAVSSLEGFNTFLHIQTNQLLPTKLTIERAMSPPLKKPKEKKQELEFSTSETPSKRDNSEIAGPSTSVTPQPIISVSTPTTSKSSAKSKKEETSQAKSSTNGTPKRAEPPKKRKIDTFFKPLGSGD